MIKARKNIVIDTIINNPVRTAAIGLLVTLVVIPQLEPKSIDDNTLKIETPSINLSRDTNKCTRNLSFDYFSCESRHVVSNLYDNVTKSRILPLLEGIAVIFGVLLFWIKLPERKREVEEAEKLAEEQAYLQRWQLIDGARGIETSGARFKALEKLHEDKHSLRGLDANQADLIGINLSKANLERANLESTLLINANLQGVNLRQAKLQKAVLRGAKLQGADLWAANLEEADLQECEPDICKRSLRKNIFIIFFSVPCALRLLIFRYLCLSLSEATLEERMTNLESANLGKANFEKAILNHANFRNANLRGANLRNTDLLGTNFTGAKLSGARFRGAKNLKSDQIKQAKEWKEAKYDKQFCIDNPDLDLCQDEDEDSEKVKNLNKIEEINEILKPFVELRNLIETGSFNSLQNTSLIQKILNSIERLQSLMAKDESISDCRAEVDTEIRSLKEAFRVIVSRKKEIDKEKIELGELDSQSEEYDKPYILAAKWLENNINMLISQGISDYLKKKPEVRNTGRVLDSSKKIKYLEIDIEKCLKKMCTCLSRIAEFDSNEIDLNLPAPIHSELFQVILEETIAPIFKNQSDELPNLPNHSREILKYYFKKSIDKLQQK